MNLPNKITLTRIGAVVLLLIGLFVCSVLPNFVAPDIGNSGINSVYLVTFVVFVLASLTDFLDGYLARKLHQVTTLGKFLDPIADKMLVNSMLIILVYPWSYAPNQQIFVPVFCVVLMVVRDLVVDTMRFVASSKCKVIAANIFGKIKTVSQMIAIPCVLLNGWPFSYFDSSWPTYLRCGYLLIYVATFFSLLSGVIYVVQNFHIFKEDKQNG